MVVKIWTSRKLNASVTRTGTWTTGVTALRAVELKISEEVIEHGNYEVILNIGREPGVGARG